PLRVASRNPDRAHDAGSDRTGPCDGANTRAVRRRRQDRCLAGGGPPPGPRAGGAAALAGLAAGRLPGARAAASQERLLRRLAAPADQACFLIESASVLTSVSMCAFSTMYGGAITSTSPAGRTRAPLWKQSRKMS